MSFEGKTSVLSQSDGSAELHIGNSKVVVSVTGPVEPKARQALPTLASLEIIVRPSVGLSTTREKLLEDKLRSLLQRVIVRYKYPRQLIQIVVQFLISDNSLGNNDFTSNELSAAINCCYFALIDANIYLNCSFASISVSLKNDLMIRYPTFEQLVECDSHHVVCFSIQDKKADKILLVESVGNFKEADLFQIISDTANDCQDIHIRQREIIQEKISHDYIWKH